MVFLGWRMSIRGRLQGRWIVLLDNENKTVSGAVLFFFAGAFEPFDEFGQVVEGAESGFERLFGHGAEFDVTDEGGAVEFADECFDGDIDTNEEVIVVLGVGVGAETVVDIWEGYAQTYDVGFFLVLELHEGHLGCFEFVFVKEDFEGFAFGLSEGDYFPPVDIGGVVGEFDYVAEEVEVAFGTDGEGTALGGLFADFEGQAVAIGSELVLHFVE